MANPVDPEQPGEPVVYRERVWPGPGTWLTVPLLAALTALAFFPVGALTAAVAVVLVLALGLTVLVRASPRVEVTATSLRAGPATLPRSDVGEVLAYAREDARAQRGTHLDARAHVMMRGWADGVVRVEVVDPQDPTPYWLLSTHRPALLAQALGGGWAASGAGEGPTGERGTGAG